jgi:hypothetical protein
MADCVLKRLENVIGYINPFDDSKPLRDAANSSQLKSAVDSLSRKEKYFTGRVRDLLVAKKKLVVDAQTANSVMKFLLSFSRGVSLRPLLQTKEVQDLIINSIAPRVTAISEFGCLICNIVQDQQSADLFTNVESFSAILKCFHRSKTFSEGGWIVFSFFFIILRHHPFFSIIAVVVVVVVVAAFCFFFRDEQILSEEEITEKNQNTLQEIVLPKLLVDSTSSQELTSALESIINQQYRFPSLIDLLLQKQHLIQDEETAIVVANFIKWFGEKDSKSIAKKEIFEMIENVLIPKFNNNNPDPIFDVFAILFTEESTRNYFSKTSFRDFVSSSLSSAGNSLLKALDLLLSNNETAKEVFGTPEFKKLFMSDFRGDISTEYNNIINLLDEAIIKIRLESLQKIVKEHRSEIDDELLRKLAEQGIDEHNMVHFSTELEKFGFSAEEIETWKRFVEVVMNYKPSNHGADRRDPFEARDHQRLRQEHSDLRKLHQDHLDKSNNVIADLTKDRDDINQKLDLEKKKLDDLTIKLVAEQKTSDDLREDRDSKQKTIFDLKAERDLEKRASAEVNFRDRTILIALVLVFSLCFWFFRSKQKIIAELTRKIYSEEQNHHSATKQRDDVQQKLDSETASHNITRLDRDSKQKTIADLEGQKKNLQNEKHQLQQRISRLENQLKYISPFANGKRYQIDFVVTGLPQPGPNPALHLAAPTSRIFAEAESLLKTGGPFVADPTHPTGFVRRPIQGYKLQELQVIVRNVAGFEDRLRLLQNFRTQAAAIANPAGFSAEQWRVLNTLRADFLPRPPGSDPKAPNLINVFHGTKPAILNSVINGIVAVGSTDAGFFGKGVYTTTSIEYAATIYAQARPDGCVPVLWCVAAVGVCYPLTREKDYSRNKMKRLFGNNVATHVSDFFGLPLNRQGTTYDCHCAVVNSNADYQAVQHQNLQFMEVVIEQEAQVLPIAVLWLKR